ncbi:MAG: XTP/dITP diphosphatase [Nitrospirales bacterium]|nr:XTP/dITP diphosphatase [Nitrospirales bacterium]
MAQPDVTLVLGTGNRHKAQEILAFLTDLPLQIKTLENFPDCPEVIEDGETCQTNAIKKAREIAAWTRHWTLADDTGLDVEALGGRPGVFAARYAGENATYADNCRKLLEDMQGVPADKRTARFLTVMALSDPEGTVEVVEGALEGVITETFYGSQGFGYDPVFFVPELGKTLAEIPLVEKNQISHRAKALQRAKDLLIHRLIPNRSSGRSAAR